METIKRNLSLLQQFQMKWIDNNRVVIGIKNIVDIFGKREFKLVVIVDGVRLRSAEFYIRNGDENTVCKYIAYSESIIRTALEEKDLKGRRSLYQ